MWKRNEAPDPASPARTDRDAAAPKSPPPAPAGAPSRPVERRVATIGPSVYIKGELTGSENLTIDGRVEGKVELPEHTLTIGPKGQLAAQIVAKAVIVQGRVLGNITTTEKVDIREQGSVEGDIVTPVVAIADGAEVRGSIDMQGRGKGT